MIMCQRQYVEPTIDIPHIQHTTERFYGTNIQYVHKHLFTKVNAKTRSINNRNTCYLVHL